MGRKMTDEIDPCDVIADLLASSLYKAAESDPRNWLYGWELRGLQYLQARLDANTYNGSMWTADLVRLNADLIRAGQIKPMNYNLRSLKQEARQ